MDNYSEILEKEKKLTKKEDLVEDTIQLINSLNTRL